MLEETKNIIELVHRLAGEIKEGLRDISSAGLDDFFNNSGGKESQLL